MKKNVGNIDVYVRYGLAAVFVVFAIIYGGWHWLLLIPAAILTITAYKKVCHVYSMFGMNTCKYDKK